MPVQEQTPYIKYVANGVTQTFSTEFDCESKDQLVVMLNGEEPAFTSWSYANKQVTFVTAPVVDTVVELKRQSKLNRTTDYQSFNHTLNYKALNSDFDRIWYAIQEQNYKAGQYDYDYNFVLTQVRPISTGGTGADNATSARNNLNVYSKGQVDALVATGGQGSVVPIDGGGTGADNAEEARANLDVYSQAEVDFKIDEATPDASTEVKGLAKIATTAIAQAGTNDTDFITALKLKQSFTSLHGDTGWERLPDGLIIQWGLAAVGVTTPFPIAFPTACYRVAVSHSSPSGGGMVFSHQSITATRTGVTMLSVGGVPNSFIAIGK
ncbi:MAG TPA: hypothetical protein DCM65_09190 [Acinetobacter junii]|nr:hypothetical protein [Acinetobacter junii]